MPARVTLVHPCGKRRRSFSRSQMADALRYRASGWSIDGDWPDLESAFAEPRETGGPVISGEPFEVVAGSPEIWVGLDLIQLVPEGPIPEVLEWVGDDPDRARAALVVEREMSARSSLISRLEQIAASETHNTPDEGEKETDL